MEEKTPEKKLIKLRTYAEDILIAQKLDHVSKPMDGSLTSNQVVKVTPPEKKDTTPRAKVGLPVEHKASKPLHTKRVSPNTTLVTKIDETTQVSHIPKIHSSNLDGEGATIITDTKHKRFGLIPAIVTSFKNWYLAKKKARLQRSIPKYSVPETALRKGVIQKATSKTAKSNTADFASIQERVQLRKQKEKDAPSITWGANTETGFLLLDSPEGVGMVDDDLAIQNVQVIPKNSPTMVSEIVGPSGFEAPEYLTNTSEDEEVMSEEVEVNTDTNVVGTSEIIPTQTETAVTTPIRKLVPQSKSVSKINWFDTNVLTVLVSATAVFIIIAGITAIMYPEKNPNGSIEITAEPGLLTNSEIMPLAITGLLHENISVALASARTNIDRLTELSLTSSDTPLEVTPIFNHLNKNANLSFVKSVKKIHFGYSSEQVPFIVFSFTDRTSVYGGMLAWENNLPYDFLSIFGLNIEIPASQFTDEQISGLDVRIYKDQNNDDALVYGLVGTTVLITTDRLTFAALIPLIN